VWNFWKTFILLYLLYRVDQIKVSPQTLIHVFTKYWSIFKILSLLHSAGNLQWKDHYRAHHTLMAMLTLPSEILMSENIACRMLWHCFLKYELAWDDVWQAATFVTEASHSNRFHELSSTLAPRSKNINYHTGVAQFRHVVCHCRSVQRQRFAPMLSFLVAAVGHSVNFSV